MAYQKQIYQDGVTEYTEELFEHMDDGIFGAYPVQLIAISDTAPSECVENDKYYNTSTKKIYTATGTNTWGSTGTTPLEDTSYWLISENGNYAWDGTDLVSIGGGKAEVVISDTEPSDGKLWVDTDTIQVIAGKENLVNVGTSVDDTFKTNLIKSDNIFDLNSNYITVNATATDIANGKRVANTVSGYGFALYIVKDLTNYVGKTISMKASFTSGRIAIGLCDKTGTSRTVGVFTETGDTSISYTIPALTTQKYLAIWLYANTTETGTATNDYTNIMVNFGESALDYEPYITPSIVVDNEEIYSKPVVERGEVTWNTTNVSGSSTGKKWYKIGNIVIVSFEFTPLSGKIANGNVICTGLPTPQSNFYFSDSGRQFFVSTSGNVAWYYPTNTSDLTRIDMTFVYVV